MSGVVDENGVQWEHCTTCTGWVRYENLKYEEPSEQYPHGRDLCPRCAIAERMKRLVKLK